LYPVLRAPTHLRRSARQSGDRVVKESMKVQILLEDAVVATQIVSI